jgi:hypothetical protein
MALAMPPLQARGRGQLGKQGQIQPVKPIDGDVEQHQHQGHYGGQDTKTRQSGHDRIKKTTATGLVDF